MAQFNIYIPVNPGKNHFLNQIETVKEDFFKKFGLRLTDSKIILLAVEQLSNDTKGKKE